MSLSQSDLAPTTAPATTPSSSPLCHPLPAARFSEQLSQAPSLESPMEGPGPGTTHSGNPTSQTSRSWHHCLSSPRLLPPGLKPQSQSFMGRGSPPCSRSTSGTSQSRSSSGFKSLSWCSRLRQGHLTCQITTCSRERSQRGPLYTEPSDFMAHSEQPPLPPALRAVRAP